VPAAIEDSRRFGQSVNRGFARRRETETAVAPPHR
jgi:hypothetical protein